MGSPEFYWMNPWNVPNFKFTFEIIKLNTQVMKSMLRTHHTNLDGVIVYGWTFPKLLALLSLEFYFFIYISGHIYLNDNDNVPEFFSHERGRSKIHSSKCRQQKAILFLVEISKMNQHPRSPKLICGDKTHFDGFIWCFCFSIYVSHPGS